jgi:hypothetical protein
MCHRVVATILFALSLTGCSALRRTVYVPVNQVVYVPPPPECPERPTVEFGMRDGLYCVDAENAKHLIVREIISTECLKQWQAWRDAVCSLKGVSCGSSASRTGSRATPE